MAEKISNGNLKQNIEIESNDEVGLLAKAFNRMSIKLRDSYTNLEEQVIDRTKELSDSKMELEALFNGITDMISVQDTDYNILMVNRSILAEYEATAETFFEKKIIGGKCYSLYMGKDKPCEFCPVEQTIKTKKPAFSEQKAGERVFHVYSYPMAGKDEKLKKIIVFRKDLTRERALQKQVIESTKLASLGELAASVANGIKNPLAGISGCSQVLRRNFEKDNIKNELLNMILSDVRRLEEIVSIFLDFAGRSSPEYKNTGINKIVEGAVQLIEEQAKSQTVTVHREYAANDSELRVDETQIRQAMINILVNALQAMPDGGTLRVRTKNEGNKVSLEIADTGTGLPSVKIGSIFDPFFNTKSQGMGLGLSIARMIVEKHGGTIGVKSSEGNETVFTIEFPLEKKEMRINNPIELRHG
jgi:two-component system NtrC family sensor kinase